MTMTTTSLSRSRTTGSNKWQRITNLETTSRKNTNIHPFVSPAKGVKKSEAPHIKKTAHHCLC